MSAVLAPIARGVGFLLAKFRLGDGLAAAPVSLGSFSLHFANTIGAQRYRTTVSTDTCRRMLWHRNMLLRIHFLLSLNREEDTVQGDFHIIHNAAVSQEFIGSLPLHKSAQYTAGWQYIEFVKPLYLIP